jgi:hypothetical protein
METRKFWVPTEPRPLNRAICNFAQLITSPQKPTVQELVKIGWLGTSPRKREI